MLNNETRKENKQKKQIYIYIYIYICQLELTFQTSNSGHYTRNPMH